MTLTLAFGVLLLVGGGLDIFVGADLPIYAAVLALGAFFLISVTTPFIAWQIRRMAHGVVGSTVEVTLNADGAEIKNAGIESKYPWSSITRAKSNGRTVSLMRDRVRYGWFTLRALDEPSRQRVLDLLRQKVAVVEMAGRWF